MKAKALKYYYDNIEKRQKYNNDYWALNGDKYKEIKKLKYQENKTKLELQKKLSMTKNKDMFTVYFD